VPTSIVRATPSASGGQDLECAAAGARRKTLVATTLDCQAMLITLALSNRNPFLRRNHVKRVQDAAKQTMPCPRFTI